MSNINDKFGENCFGGRMRIQTEVVNGICPTCNVSAVLVSLFKTRYRCVNCGSDLEQKVNGVISYIPMGNPNTRMVLEENDGPQEA
jgi:transposase-like protein|tara:strand:- start:561 stop:818 length:258 start_codon:yes stop_codon:yes gene_type:complete